MTVTSPLPETIPTLTPPSEPAPRRVTDGAGDPDCPHCHGLGYLRDEVPIGHPQFGKLSPCVCQLENMQVERASQLRRESNTEALSGKTFDNFIQEGITPDPAIRASVRLAFERCRAFAESPDLPNKDNPKQNWLLLVGTYGCGKTHLAAAIANYCLANNKPILFLNTPDLLDYLRAAFAPSSNSPYSQRFDEVRTVPILILDDLGTESPTQWAIEKLYQILNYRYNAHLPTIITTNKKIDDLDPRVGSRLSDSEIVGQLHILAPDFRAGKSHLSSSLSTLAVHRNQTFETLDLRSDLTGEARQMFLRAVQSAQEYAAKPQGWMVLVGPFGSGKTHLAAAIANQRVYGAKPVVFATYQDVMELFRSASKLEADERNLMLQEVKSIELLVIDDVSNSLSTAGYFRERFFDIINYRFDAQLPTILTTSVEEDELDPRLKSRILYSEMCQVHVLKATPYRGKKKISRKK